MKKARVLAVAAVTFAIIVPVSRGILDLSIQLCALSSSVGIVLAVASFALYLGQPKRLGDRLTSIAVLLIVVFSLSRLVWTFLLPAEFVG